MPSPLMKSVSGIRGIVGKTITPELITRVGAALAVYLKEGTVIVGRDTRPTGPAIASGIISALSLHGCDVIDIGVVPTPTVQIMVEELRACGGVVVSASHNSIEWNAFKLIGSTGTFFNTTEMKTLYSAMEDLPPLKEWGQVGHISIDDSARDLHIKKAMAVIDREAVREKKFKVVLDSVNGAGSGITLDMLSQYGCQVYPLHCREDGLFPRGPEPVPENLNALSSAVIKEGADIGFAQDPDADRLAIVDEKGRPIGEEYTLALVTEHMLSIQKGRVVINLSTTRAIEDIAERYAARVDRTSVGEINVVEEMLRAGARIGGEGNGGVISPEVHLGRDSLVGIGYVLEMMSRRGKTVSELVRDLPRYVMKKGKIALNKGEDSLSLLEKAQSRYKREKIDNRDGLRIEFSNEEAFAGGWVHLRPSNTEPVFRIIAEGREAEQAELIYRHFRDLLGS